MSILFLRDWRGYKAGRVITPGDGMANVLIRRGIAKPVIDAKVKKAVKK
jgi:hypothetical protein